MFLLVFDVFKIGVGLFLFYMMGLMVVGGCFLELLCVQFFYVVGLCVSLYGSLVFIGKGYVMDCVIIFGFVGFLFEIMDVEVVEIVLEVNCESCVLLFVGLGDLSFDLVCDLIFDFDCVLFGYVNGMMLMVIDVQGDVIYLQIYYLIGGGFVMIEVEFVVCGDDMCSDDVLKVFYFFVLVVEMFEMVEKLGKSIVWMKCENECVYCMDVQILEGIVWIWQVMCDCMDWGLVMGGILFGGLLIWCCVLGIYEVLKVEVGMNLIVLYVINDWMLIYVMVVNEENVVGGQVVIVFINGVVGVVFVVICYWLDYVLGVSLW